jgi:putative peptide zinc metalloprotease protein
MRNQGQTHNTAVPHRLRTDLVIREQKFQDELTWVIKDPIGLKYYRFESHEFFILSILDNKNSLDDIFNKFQLEFPNRDLTREELSYFLNNLVGSGLLISDIPGQGSRLYQREKESQKGKILRKFSGFMSIRIKGFDPEWLFKVIYPLVKFMYSPACVVACLLLMVSALGLVIVQNDELISKIPTFYDLFAAKNALWMMLALSIAKVLHEFGHGLTCKHFGGETHEMGVMFLCMTPCLYVNVSDSWMLPQKWKRILIMAAGMYVELVLASISVFLWWFSGPGFLNELCLRMIMVCSVTTIFFNANPLMRYDGYYILSDYYEIPNLRQQSNQYLKQRLSSMLFGISQPENRFLPQRHRRLFLVYSIASSLYKWMIAISISWLLVRILEPYELQVIGYLYAAYSLFGLLVLPVIKFITFLINSETRNLMDRSRFTVTAMATAMILCCIVGIPFNYDVVTPVEVAPGNSSTVYIKVPGQLKKIHVQPGDVIKEGTPLAEFSNLDMELSLTELEENRDRYLVQINNLKQMRFHQPEVQKDLKQYEMLLKKSEEQITLMKQKSEYLTLTASISGVVLSGKEKELKNGNKDSLSDWSGTLLNKKNIGCFAQTGTEFCMIDSSPAQYAGMVVTQDELEFVHIGDSVALKFKSHPGVLFTGTIEAIAAENDEEQPDFENSKSNFVMTKMEKTDKYLARIRLDERKEKLLVGSTGQARIRSKKLTVAQRTLRYFHKTFGIAL